MVQRSPTYVVSRPAHDRPANGLRALLPEAWAYALTRWKNIAFQRASSIRRTRTKPEDTKRRMLAMLKKALPTEMVDAHFTPATTLGMSGCLGSRRGSSRLFGPAKPQ